MDRAPPGICPVLPTTACDRPCRSRPPRRTAGAVVRQISARPVGASTAVRAREGPVHASQPSGEWLLTLVGHAAPHEARRNDGRVRPWARSPQPAACPQDALPGTDRGNPIPAFPALCAPVPNGPANGAVTGSPQGDALSTYACQSHFEHSLVARSILPFLCARRVAGHGED